MKKFLATTALVAAAMFAATLANGATMGTEKFGPPAHQSKVLALAEQALLVKNDNGSLSVYCADKNSIGFYTTDLPGVIDEVSSFCPTPQPKPATTK